LPATTELDISEGTVKAHMKSLLPKLEASDRTHAVTIALKRGIRQLIVHWFAHGKVAVRTIGAV
jgi:hypothetical protein